MAQIGLRDLVYANLQNDNETGATYDAVKKVTGAMSANISPAVNTGNLYSDDGLSETASSLGAITLALNTKDLPKQVQADLLGHTINGDGVLIKSSTDAAPYVAIGFRSLKSDQKSYRYVWLYKGKFAPQEQSYVTKGETPEFQTPTINGTFVRREFDNQWQAEVDSDDESITDTTIFDNWFNQVYSESVSV